MIARLAVLLMLFAVPAGARCVVLQDLENGVIFSRADGQNGSVIRIGPQEVQIDYRRGDTEQRDRRTARLGLYESEISSGSFPADVIGVWSEKETRRDFQGRPPQPQPGEVWETTIRLRSDISDFSGMPQTERQRLTARYDFQMLQEVTLDGCAYRMMPVEVSLRGGRMPVIQRIAYFPDLGFGIETQLTYPSTGVVNTNGIISIRPAS